ncbi:uncharacterized protein LOC132796345 [Drosophila nasuta]|uniref:uncharacterized protein LOC132796345 n=1 Tax=Drosophila nasuta TaxID=42062 RepID=UPI00295ED7EB|nr:uncharacterized protein LOC132796345 [Drosophila nasuta]XP_060663471.1 uncharacterized protein LOC132796345 [Drosophila nasuta]
MDNSCGFCGMQLDPESMLCNLCDNDDDLNNYLSSSMENSDVEDSSDTQTEVALESLANGGYVPSDDDLEVDEDNYQFDILFNMCVLEAFLVVSKINDDNMNN